MQDQISESKTRSQLYEPLDSHDRETRLVTLQQGHFEDTIRCNLSKVSLKDEPYFQALSYTWGDLSITGQIYLNGQPHHVTKNLESALRHLRHISEPRVLWIDALCINQEDVLERNSQVIHMNSIYKKASEVVAWMGEEAEESNLVFDAFEALLKYDSTHLNTEADPVVQKILSEPQYAKAIWLFFQRSWWNRVWTVQESVLPHTLYFVCGHRHISADRLSAVYNCLDIHCMSCCQDMLREIYSEIFESFGSLHILYNSRAIADKGTDIENLLANYRSRHCTDPRDKIYGLLGMLRSEDARLIVPNYSNSVPKVYEEAVLKIIGHTRKLQIFSQLYPQSVAGITTTKLPSWVPNWTSSYRQLDFQAAALRFEMIGQYEASATSSAQIRSIKQGKIALRGIMFSSCAKFSELNCLITGGLKGGLDLAGITTYPNRPYANSSSTTYYDAYWQTLCCSILPPPSDLNGAERLRRSNYSCQRSWYEAWLNQDPSDPDTLPSGPTSSETAYSSVTSSEISTFRGFFCIATAMRKLFISEKEEWLGLAPMDAEVGDRIALLEGGNVPYILRQKPGQENEWLIIGDAYVHGIMDGEGWNRDQLVDIVLV